MEAIKVVSLVGCALISFLIVAIEHYLPWQMILRKELPRLSAYIMGMLAIALPVTVHWTLFKIARVLIDAQVILRVNQAIRRDKTLTSLLMPVLEEMERVDHALASALVVIGDVWKDGTEHGWQ